MLDRFAAWTRFVLLAATTSTLLACGQSGPLRLPDKPDEAPASSTSEVTNTSNASAQE
ncbi:LPS translocon maturation chaperone LptM [Teredinibacter turnerae]|uniref:LPS translocon maturation chaperone LptM n=1 Tax=Teredinibacter turnerae TaxID=2426 RepID=UPI00039F3DA6|nr:lipoprotein [Teredinibacter turnerae]